jgi:hypothetical protein
MKCVEAVTEDGCKEINVIRVDSLSEGQAMQKCASPCPLKNHTDLTLLTGLPVRINPEPHDA